MTPSNLRYATLAWQQAGLRFTASQPGGPAVTIDGDGEAGPSPFVSLLIAAGSCAASDVVLILEKMRVGLRECRVDLTGTRHEGDPRRLVALDLTFHLRGDDLDETRARRAIDLSLGKYCSVMASLAPDIPIRYQLDLG
jgi:putative redox protein